MSAPLRDVVVIGSGHNGLVAACYLARAGLDVEVVERDTVVGGAVSTVERFPGHRVDRGSSAHFVIRHTGILEELELESHGLRYLDLDPWAFYPIAGAAGGGITFWVDIDRTCASVEAVCGPRDADAYRAFARDWARRNEQVIAAFCGPPTPGRLGRSLWGIGRGTGLPGVELARQFLTTGDALLDAHFRDERLKTALAWLGAQAGPPTSEVASADLVGWNMLNHRRAPGRPVGGSGMLTAALATRLGADGGTVRCGDPVTEITGGAGGASGVRTKSGATIGARVVVAGCDVLTTVDLAAGLLPAALVARAHDTIRVGNGIGMVARLATAGLPRYPDADAAVYSALQLVVPSRAALRRAHADFASGRAPAEPAVLAMTFSALDRTLAPTGEHNVTLWGQWHPFELADECWGDIGARETDKMIAAVERVAPGFTDTVRDAFVQTPADLAAELALPRGNVMHVEMSLDAMFAWRPLPELAGYRTPVENLYLTGASTHPGGGVSGASGRNTAHVVLRDLQRRSRRRRLARAAHPRRAKDERRA